MSLISAEPDAFRPLDLDGILAFFAANGFVRIAGVFSDEQLGALQTDMERCQRDLLAGLLPEQCGTVILDDPEAMVEGEPFAHYVCHCTEVSTIARDCAYHPDIVAVIQRLLGPEAWLLDDDRFGVVYQDARPGRESGYSRIGWHTDWQSGPHLDIWPSVAFTVHLDATSPANGFLRVLPGSHLGGTDGIPLGFEKVPGEIALYCDFGDVLLHDAHLWHSAARATEDPPAGVRRHIRGGWHAGTRLEPGHGTDDFVKNARR